MPLRRFARLPSLLHQLQPRSQHAGGAAALQRAYSAASGSPLLIRDYIQQSLYHPSHGYFSSQTPPVGRLEEAIHYNRIVGETEYKVHLQRLYKQLGVAWLTPVEIFKPWYGYALAKYILEYHRHVLQQPGPLTIYEVGGGTGTLATCVLDYLRHVAPHVYQHTSYTCLEISEQLAQRQQHYAGHQAGHQQQLRVVRGSGWDAASWGEQQEGHCFVLMMEVLDNLPHDRVVRSGPDGAWQQTLAVPDGAPGDPSCTWREKLQPASDPLIQRCLEGHAALRARGDAAAQRAASASAASQASSSSSGDGGWSFVQRLIDFTAGVDEAAQQQQQQQVVWLPTACLSLLDCIVAARPNHTLIAADFDALPNVRVEGLNAPLVSGKVGGRRRDHDSIFVPWGTADIFFPTDFDLLAWMYRQAAASASQQLAQRQQQQQAGQQQAGQQHAGQQQAGQQEAGQQQAGQQEAAITATHAAQGQFMDQLADKDATRTIGGWDPLRQDFHNTRLFTGSCRQPGGPG